jgi:hypothetical protein
MRPRSLLRKGRFKYMILLEEKASKEGVEERLPKVGGKHNQGERYKIYYTHCGNNVSHEANDCRFPWEKIKEDIQNHK